MKKLVLFLLLMAAASYSFAQAPTLTSSNSYSVGETHLVYSTDTFSIADTIGAGLTWDYSTLPINSTDTEYFSACSASPSCDSFPGTTVYGHQSGTTVAAYYNTTSTTMSIDGEASTGDVAYSNYEDLFRYPFTYNSSYVDTLEAFFTSGGESWHRYGTVTVTGAAYGKLILPNGTYNRALLVHRVENYADSLVGLPFGFAYISDIWTWYAAGNNEYLLSNTTFNTGGATGHIDLFTNQAPNTTGVTLVNAAQPTATVFPNPATDVLNVSFTLARETPVSIVLSDVTGKSIVITENINYVSGTHSIAYPVNNLPKGLYLLRLSASGTTIVKKVSIQ